jgi:hypothetical protein
LFACCVALTLLLAGSARTAATNLIANPSVEASADGVTPNGFSPSAAGGASVSYAWVSTGHSGARGLGVTVSRRGSGKVAWVPDPVAATAKTDYMFSDWYESAVASAVSVVVTKANGKTSTVASVSEPASGGWALAQVSFTTPAGTSSVTAYQSISAVGSLTTDDYDLEGPAASSSPSVVVLGAGDGSVVSGQEALSAAADGAGLAVKTVQFQLDGDDLGPALKTAPYLFSWDTAGAGNGPHVLTAVLTTKKGGSAVSDPVGVTVSNVCTIEATASCDSVGGTFITFTDVTSAPNSTVFTCNGPLTSYRSPRASITGSGWPVHLDIDYTPGVYDYTDGVPVSAGVVADLDGVSLGDGCAGDGNPDTIDLIVNIEGDGRTYGLEQDALKLVGNTGPTNLQLTTGGGAIDCGPRQGSDTSNVTHQDAIQVQSGSGVGFFGVTIGDWANDRATCWGAGGAFFISAAGGHSGKSITVDGMKAVSCNHGLNGDAGGAPTSGTITDSVFRTGRPSDRTDLLVTTDPATGTPTVGLCSFASAPLSAAAVGLSSWTLGNVIGDAWSASGDPWSPGFDPAYDGGA